MNESFDALDNSARSKHEAFAGDDAKLTLDRPVSELTFRMRQLHGKCRSLV